MSPAASTTIRIAPTATTSLPSARTSSTSPVPPVASRTADPSHDRPAAPPLTAGVCLLPLSRSPCSRMPSSTIRRASRAAASSAAARAAPSASSTRCRASSRYAPRLLPPGAVGVLLPPLSSVSRARLALVLHREPRLQRLELQPRARSSARLRRPQLALPFLHRARAARRGCAPRPGPAPPRRRGSPASTPSRRAMARP